MVEHPEYDIYLAYHHLDQEPVREVAEALHRAGIRPWFAGWHAPSSQIVQHRIGRVLHRSSACAVCIGRHGLSDRMRLALQAAVNRQVKDPEFRIIPVLLPELPADFDTSSLPPGLRAQTAVDLRNDSGALQGLIEQLRGKTRVQEQDDLMSRVGDEAQEQRRVQPGLASATGTVSVSQDFRRQTRGERTTRSGAPIHDLRFSALYPKEVTPENWHTLRAYVFRARAERQVAAHARRFLGQDRAQYRQAEAAASRPVRAGAQITATPRVEGVEFNPASIRLGLLEDWHALDFRFRAAPESVNRALNGFLTFSVHAVTIAGIPLSIYVGDQVMSEDMHELMSQEPYGAVFCSYSHRDEPVVRSVERAYRILGLDCLRDIRVLRSGERWSDRLLELIDQSDVFQLFWSPHAASSDHVTREWRHALELGRDDDRFIRPCYWSRPMPEPPSELDHLHFAYEPDLAEQPGG